MQVALAFLSFAFVAAITPGPSNVMISATGASAGFVRGLPCAVGTSLGMGFLLFCAGLGLGRLVTSWPALLLAMNWGGATFLLWLAWKIGTAGPPSSTASAEPVGFFQAALFQWVNPKAWLVAVSAAGTYLQGGNERVYQALALGALFVAASIPSCLLWLSAGASLQRLLRGERAARRFNIAMGLLLAASIVPMFV